MLGPGECNIIKLTPQHLIISITVSFFVSIDIQIHTHTHTHTHTYFLSDGSSGTPHQHPCRSCMLQRMNFSLSAFNPHYLDSVKNLPILYISSLYLTLGYPVLYLLLYCSRFIFHISRFLWQNFLTAHGLYNPKHRSS